jgi:membrane carboxypeptidase/penicillin-binding protein
VAGFWFGFDKPGQISGDASGGRLAAPAWAEFYTQGWRETATSSAWRPPAGMSSRVIDPQTGYLATDWCPIRQQEYFKPGTEPHAECPEHGPDMYYEEQQSADWPDQRDWGNDFGKKVGKALGKIFRF